MSNVNTYRSWHVLLLPSSRNSNEDTVFRRRSFCVHKAIHFNIDEPVDGMMSKAVPVLDPSRSFQDFLTQEYWLELLDEVVTELMLLLYLFLTLLLQT